MSSPIAPRAGAWIQKNNKLRKGDREEAFQNRFIKIDPERAKLQPSDIMKKIKLKRPKVDAFDDSINSPDPTSEPEDLHKEIAIRKKRKRITKKKRKRLVFILIIFVAIVVYATIYTKHQARIEKERQIRENVGTIEKYDKNNKDPKKKNYVLNSDYGNDNTDESDRAAAVVTVIDVGFGESVFVKAGDKEVLIDGGKEKDAKKILKTISKDVNGNLDYVINTDPTPERAGGLPTIISEFKVDNVIYSKKPISNKKEKLYFQALKKAANGDKKTTFRQGKNEILDLGKGVSVSLIQVSPDDDTDQNLICKISNGNDSSITVLSSTDESESQRIVNEIGSTNVVIAGNHGAVSYTNPSAVSKWEADQMIFSSDSPKKNNGLYPAYDVVKSLDDVCDCYGTYATGNFYLFMRKDSITITKTRNEEAETAEEIQEINSENYNQVSKIKKGTVLE